MEAKGFVAEARVSLVLKVPGLGIHAINRQLYQAQFPKGERILKTRLCSCLVRTTR